MNDLNKWCADQAGVELFTHTTNTGTILETSTTGFSYNYENFYFEWDIRDARCREVVREHFKIHTNWMESKEVWEVFSEDIVDYGKTIAESEVACIQKLYEASHDLP